MNDIFELDKFTTMIRKNKIFGAIFFSFLVICLTSKVWMGFIYKPMQDFNTNIPIYLKDSTFIVNTQKSKRITDSKFKQVIDSTYTSQVSTTNPVILVIQDDKLLATFVVKEKDKTELVLEFEVISKNHITFRFYQPPPIVANNLLETNNYDSIQDYYIQSVQVDFRNY
jgi:hypothetical protein